MTLPETQFAQLATTLVDFAAYQKLTDAGRVSAVRMIRSVYPALEVPETPSDELLWRLVFRATLNLPVGGIKPVITEDVVSHTVDCVSIVVRPAWDQFCARFITYFKMFPHQNCWELPTEVRKIVTEFMPEIFDVLYGGTRPPMTRESMYEHLAQLQRNPMVSFYDTYPQWRSTIDTELEKVYEAFAVTAANEQYRREAAATKPNQARTPHEEFQQLMAPLYLRKFNDLPPLAWKYVSRYVDWILQAIYGTDWHTYGSKSCTLSYKYDLLIFLVAMDDYKPLCTARPEWTATTLATITPLLKRITAALELPPVTTTPTDRLATIEAKLDDVLLLLRALQAK